MLGATCAVMAGTLLAAVLLFGRFVLLAAGFFIAGTALITLKTALMTHTQLGVVLVLALVLIVVGWPGIARRRGARS